jgi:hypothetical protein
VPPFWDGVSFADALRTGTENGREYVVTSQGAWTCQRGVRWGDHLYLRTWHDGFHWWPDRMLFDVATDPHEQHDLVEQTPEVAGHGAALLDQWYAEQMRGAPGLVDPLFQVMQEGGPFHTRGHLPEYLDRLRDTGRTQWADSLARRYPESARSRQA